MHILLACAKLMNDVMPSRHVADTTQPRFKRNADMIAAELARYSVDELQHILGTNRAIAVENHLRYRDFCIEATRRPAAFLYDGMVFKKLMFENFSDDDLAYANSRLTICSFLYGILRPLDLINPYRLEGNVELPCTGGKTMFEYWRPLLTDTLIEAVKTSGGTLVNLASAEMKGLFDWKRVMKETHVVTPSFKVLKDGKERNVTIYAKMCRGEMARYILKTHVNDPAGLAGFEYEGFRLHDPGTFTFLVQ